MEPERRFTKAELMEKFAAEIPIALAGIPLYGPRESNPLYYIDEGIRKLLVFDRFYEDFETGHGSILNKMLLSAIKQFQQFMNKEDDFIGVIETRRFNNSKTYGITVDGVFYSKDDYYYKMTSGVRTDNTWTRELLVAKKVPRGWIFDPEKMFTYSTDN